MTRTLAGMVARVKTLLKSLERATSIEDATKKGQVQEFFRKKFQRRRGQSVAEWVNVFEKAVLDTKTDSLNNELMTMGWHPFEKGNWTLERQERLLEAAECENDFAVIQSALTKVFPDSIICQEKRPLHESRTLSWAGNRVTMGVTGSQDLGTGG